MTDEFDYLSDEQLAAIASGQPAPASVPSDDGFSHLSDQQLADIAGTDVNGNPIVDATFLQAAEYTAKAIPEGYGRLGDFILNAGLYGAKAILPKGIFANNTLGAKTVNPLETAMHSIFGRPEDSGIVQKPGSKFDPKYAKAAIQGATFPLGGPVSNAAATVAGEVTHDIYPESTILPIAASLVAGAGPTLLRAGLSKAIGPQTESSALAKVGAALDYFTEADDLAASIKAAKQEPLGSLKSSAELIQSPELAIIEQNLGSSGNKGAQFAAEQAAKQDLVKSFLEENFSAAKNIPAEITGEAAQSAFAAQKLLDKAKVRELYGQIPKDTVIDLGSLQDEINLAKKTYFGPGSPEIPSALKERLDFLERPQVSTEDILSGKIKLSELKDPNITLEELKNARSHLITLSKVAQRGGHNEEAALASTVADSIKDKIYKAPEGATEWRAANAEAAKVFAKYDGQGVVKAPLKGIEKALPSKVYDKILSTPEASAQFKNVVGESGVTSIKDQIASELSTLLTNKQENKAINFIRDNKSQLQNLLGSDYAPLESIENYLSAKSGAQKLANATRGSNTALKLSNVIEKAMTGKSSTPELGLWAKVLGAGGVAGAAFAHPLVAIPTVIAGTAVKALKNRSSNLVENALAASIRNPETLLKGLISAKSVPGLGTELLTSSAKSGAVAAAINNSSSLSKKDERDLQTKIWGKPMKEDGISKAPKVIEAKRVTSKLRSPEFINKQLEKLPVSVRSQLKENPYALATALAESNLDPWAKNKDSTASGLFQFINSTARAYKLTDPFNPEKNLKAFNQFTDENKAIIKSEDPFDLYGAHVLGPGLYRKVMQGDRLNEDEKKKVAYFYTEALPNYKGAFQSIQELT